MSQTYASPIDFNYGKDQVNLFLISPFGNIFQFNKLISFSGSNEYTTLSFKIITGQKTNLSISDGFKGSLEWVRTDAGIENETIAVQTAFLTNGTAGYWQMQQQVKELDGSVSSFNYEQVDFKLSDFGSYMGDKEVRQKGEWTSQQRRSI